MLSAEQHPREVGLGGAARGTRWIALGFIALGLLIVAFDTTIVTVALPTVQRALGFSDAERQWVVTAYGLSFAGLLLLGGRVVDALGPKRAFLLGVAGFALTSALGGAASSFAMLAGARALQGAYAALLSPGALALLAVSFTRSDERARAFGIYGGVAASGAALGLVAGGLLTELSNCRLCFYMNLIPCAIALGGIFSSLPASPPGRRTALDLLGALLATLGLCSVVYAASASSLANVSGTARPVSLAIGFTCLVLFGLRQRATPAPLLPLHLIADRRRALACAVAALAVVAMFGLFLLLTYYFQVARHYSPLQTGLAFLPMSLAALTGSSLIAARLSRHVSPPGLMRGGLLVAAAGMGLLTRVDPHSLYALQILPAEVLAGMGIGLTMMPAFGVATERVAAHEAGIASALITTAQQFGGALGASLLNTMRNSTRWPIASTPSCTDIPARRPAGRRSCS